MKTIEHILKTKKKEIWTIAPDTTVFEALKVMADKDIGALPVVEGKRLVGIFSERDYARKVILKGKSSKKMLVSEIMSTKTITVTPNQTNEHALVIMTDKHIRHLPVVREEELVGFISIGDLVKSIIDEQREEIKQLGQVIGEKSGWY
jgi:CBS domain-containing protein